MDIKNIIYNHALWLGDNTKGARANFSDVNLSGVDFSDVNLSGANFSDVNLSKTNFYGANLSGVNFFGASFFEVDLSFADFYGANLSEADFSKTSIYRAKNIFSAGYRSDGYEFFAVNHGDGLIMIKAGCRWFSWDDAFKHWSKTRGGTVLGEETLFMLHYIKQKAKWFKWNYS